MLWLKRCWFPQWEHLRPGGVLIASRGARPELRLIIGKAAQKEMRAKWHADDHDAFAAQEERRSSW